jgi:hypothetical protein
MKDSPTENRMLCPCCGQDVSVSYVESKFGKLAQHFVEVGAGQRFECIGSLKTPAQAEDCVYDT